MRLQAVLWCPHQRLLHSCCLQELAHIERNPLAHEMLEPQANLKRTPCAPHALERDRSVLPIELSAVCKAIWQLDWGCVPEHSARLKAVRLACAWGVHGVRKGCAPGFNYAG